MWQLSHSGHAISCLLMPLFPAADVSYSDFCVNEMWSEGAELHPHEVSGGAGLGGDMGLYLLVCIHWHEEELTAEWATGKGGWSSRHQWIWEAGENNRGKKCMEMAFSWAKSGLFARTGLGLPIPVPEASTASDELWSRHGFACVSFRHCSSVNMIECWAEGEVSGCWAGFLQPGELSGHCWLKVSLRWIGLDLSYNCRHSMVWCTALMYCESILYPAARWLVPYWSLNSERES